MDKFLLTSELKDETFGRPQHVLGYYVYVWFDCGKPFYIGMGKNRRAWNSHLEPAETIRRQSKNFKVQIVRSRLTKPSAHALERRLLRLSKGIVNARISKKKG